MTLVEIVFAVVKILIMVGFFVNMAALGIWADRRQSAMVQDRVGPNRAVVTLPSTIVRAIVLLPPCLLGAFAWAPAIPFLGAYYSMRPIAGEVLTISAQLAVLVTWFSLLVLTATVRSGGPINRFEQLFADLDPRTFFYAGVAGHAVVFALTSLVPADAVIIAARVTSGLLGSIFFVTGLYAASRVPEGPIDLRLAGLLHSAADAVKLILKEDFVPKNADRLLHALAPMIALFPALVTMAVLPFGRTLCLQNNPAKPMDWSNIGHIAPAVGREMICKGHEVKLQIADLNVGILYIFALASTGVIGAAIAGWASDNKYSLLGGLRAASQMVSYEVAMGLSLVGLFLVYGSLRLNNMVEWQGENAWGIFVQPFAFFLFLAALAAETKRVPFDQPEGESEIVAGYFVEYSGMKFGMFFMGEYIDLFVSSAILVTLFFGGYQLPFLHADGISVAFGDLKLFEYKMTHIAVVVISMLVFFGKTMLMTWVQVFFRWTLPRFRYDQVMKLGWTKLLPLSLANMMITGIIVLALENGGPGVQSVMRVLGDITQGIVALGAVAAFVALVVGLLEPVERKKFLQSTAARFAAAAGGTKAEPQQA
ncbi:NADH-ubiquinone oxidoreductase chain H [Minicystis rosea]|nr:NADH-ubiquinone oxidoreductase chain H [Minicystis rosea]